MTSFTRRDLLSVAAGAAAATTLPINRPARAATPPAGKQTAVPRATDAFASATRGETPAR